MKRTKYVGPLYLPVEVFTLLEHAGAAAERDPLQEARWLLLRALTTETAPPLDDNRVAPVLVGTATVADRGH